MELGQLSQMTWLSLDGNQLTGGIPAELGQLTHLQGLRLQTNQLTGGIPMELAQLTRLGGTVKLSRNLAFWSRNRSSV